MSTRYKMKHVDALKVFGLDGRASFEEIKIAYRKACSQYHPDRNPAGLEMMKVINVAWESLSDYVAGSVEEEGEEAVNLSEEMNGALNAIMGLGLEIEVCGVWIWVGGDTRQHKEILKAAGYRWSPVKMMWHWRPSDSKRSWSRGKFSMDEIRAAHGSVRVKPKQYARVEG